MATIFCGFNSRRNLLDESSLSRVLLPSAIVSRRGVPPNCFPVVLFSPCCISSGAFASAAPFAQTQSLMTPRLKLQGARQPGALRAVGP